MSNHSGADVGSSEAEKYQMEDFLSWLESYQNSRRWTHWPPRVKVSMKRRIFSR